MLVVIPFTRGCQVLLVNWMCRGVHTLLTVFMSGPRLSIETNRIETKNVKNFSLFPRLFLQFNLLFFIQISVFNTQAPIVLSIKNGKDSQVIVFHFRHLKSDITFDFLIPSHSRLWLYVGKWEVRNPALDSTVVTSRGVIVVIWGDRVSPF